MSCSRHRLKIFKYAIFIYWHLMSNLCPLVENSQACVAAILISQRQARGLQEGEEVFQNIKIILRNMDLLPQKIPRNWKVTFLKQNLSPGICIEADVQWVLFSQPTSRRISNDMYISNAINNIITDQYFCCVVTAEPQQLQFSARWNYFCTVTPVLWRRLIDTHAHAHTY
jgi:hypothetical protein